MSAENGTTCEAIVTLYGIDLGRCHGAPAAPYIGACEHEHVKERMLCEFHVSTVEAAVCRTCYELPEPHAHDCPIVLTLAGVR